MQGHDAFDTGLRLLPMMGGLVARRRRGRTGSWPGSARQIPVTVGLAVIAGGLVLGATTAVGRRVRAGRRPGSRIVGFGVGLALAPAMDAVLGELPTDAGRLRHRADDDAAPGRRGARGRRCWAACWPARTPAGWTWPGCRRRRPQAAARLGVRGGGGRRAGCTTPRWRPAPRRPTCTRMDVVLLVCAAIAALGAVLVALGACPAPIRRQPAAESEHELTRAA